MRTALLISLFGLFLNHQALALTAIQITRLNILKDLPLADLQEVDILVSGASKFEQPVTQAPASVTIITADEIKQSGFRSVGEILDSVRGIDMNDDLFYQFIGMRGFSRSGDLSSRLLVLLDGQRINDNVYESAPFAKDFMVDVDLIKRVEVVRGPAAAVYGTNAIFGIINVITKTTQDLAGNELKLSAQDDEHVQARLSHGTRWGESELLVSLTHHRYPGQAIYYPEYADSDGGIAHQQDAEDGLSGFIKLHYRNWHFSAAQVKRNKDIGNGYAWTLFNSDSHAQDTHRHASLSYHQQFANDLSLSASLRYDQMQYSADYIYPGTQRNLTQALDYNSSEAQGRWWTTELSLRRTDGRHHWLAGIEYQYNQTQQRINYYRDPYWLFDDMPRQNRCQWALFVQDDIKLSQALSLSATLRYDAYSNSDATISPRLALIYQLSRHDQVKILFGQAFRTANALELTYRNTQDLKAEDIRAIELSLEHRINEDLQAVMSLYQNDLDGVYGWQYDDTLKDWLVINAATFTSQGLELAIHGDWADNWSGRASYAYQDYSSSDITQVHSNAPQHVFKFNLAYRINSRYSLGWRTYINSSRATGVAATPELTGYTVSHLSLLAAPWGKHLELAMHVYNAFDQAYQHPADFNNYRQISMPQPRRTLGLSLSYRF